MARLLGGSRLWREPSTTQPRKHIMLLPRGRPLDRYGWFENMTPITRIFDRGRDASHLAPPARIRTGGITASGSYLGCLTAKRTSCRLPYAEQPWRLTRRT